jgi:putative ABC transport system permease protein
MFLENFFISVSSIYSNKIRSGLTALGIVIGVSSVTLVGTLISGLDQSFENSMSWLGKDILYLSRWEWFSDMEWWEVKNRPKMKLEYADKIREMSNYAIAVSPVMQRSATISKDETTTNTQIFGTNVEYLETVSEEISNGRFFSKGEERSGSRVTIIGNGIKEAFFNTIDPIGKNIKIDGLKFKVIGVLEKQGKFLGLFNVDNQAILPIGAYTRIFSKRGFMRISVKVPQDNIESAKDEIYSIMRIIRGLKLSEEDDFAINQTKAFEKQYNALKIAIGGTGLFITVLSLIVGGIGIMNIMFVTVRERTREIGIRKAMGATKNLILMQFLMESICISLLGGLIGLSFAYGISYFINKIFPSTLPIWLSLISILISLIIGVLSGLIPSYNAAKLDPIEALRHE